MQLHSLLPVYSAAKKLVATEHFIKCCSPINDDFPNFLCDILIQLQNIADYYRKINLRKKEHSTFPYVVYGNRNGVPMYGTAHCRPVPREGSGVLLLKSSIHMNLYCVYVGHTHLIDNSTHFRKKNPPVSKAGPALFLWCSPIGAVLAPRM